ncbi:MAG: hypothetical protein OHK005_05020 [Candidatus Methylacidiphilales bacterium]
MKIALCLVLTTALLTGLGFAQRSAIDTVETQQTLQRFERVDPAGHAEKKKQVILDDSEDFGRQVLLQPTRTRPYFEATTNHDLIYTDNAGLNKNNIQGSWLWVGNFLLRGYAPLPKQWDSLTITLDVQETFYRYENNTANQLDFNRDAAALNATYNYRNEWIFGTGYGINQLRSNSSTINTFYSEGVVNWSATRLFPFGEDAVAFAGYLGQYHHTSNSNPRGSFDRVSNALVLGYNRQIMPRLMVQTLYKLQGDTYTQPALDGSINPASTDFGRLVNNRQDINNLLSVSLIYTPTEWATVRTAFTSVFHNSNDEDRDYTNLQGTAASVQLTFRY